MSERNIVLFGTRSSPTLLRTLQNEVLFGLDNLEQKLAFVSRMLLYRVCAVDPAWIHAFLACVQSGDGRVISLAI